MSAIARVLILLVSVSSTFGQTNKQQSAKPRLEVAVRVEAYSLVVSVKNETRSNLNIEKWQLPWGVNDGMTLVAVESGVSAGRLLNSQPHLDERSPSAFVIHSGETKSGKIDLKDRFPDIERILKSNSVILFWYYGFAIGEEPAEPFAGIVTIPKRR